VPVAAHSLRECRRAMERRGRLFAFLGYPVIPRLARMLARLVDGTDFRIRETGENRAGGYRDVDARACAFVRPRVYI
jgi:hypothetical protein